MESPPENIDDLKLARASVGLLADLERDLPRLLWRRTTPRHAHRRAKARNIDHIVNLIEPFQGEPHLLDAKLKAIIPPLVDAYLQSLSIDEKLGTNDHAGLQSAIGFFNNEPRFLQLILSATERTQNADSNDWQLSYVLLLWLSHLLLAPFDLATFSADTIAYVPQLSLLHPLPSIASRILQVGLKYMFSPTKAQEAAARMLAKLVTRPDMQKLRLADSLVEKSLRDLVSDDGSSSAISLIYQQIGILRLLGDLATSADLDYLVPEIYYSCRKILERGDESALNSSAVAKKVVIKIIRNSVILSLRSVNTSKTLASVLQTTPILEDTIDHLLHSLEDRETPVRYAAAKALSLLISELDRDMGLEVIQAVLDNFKEDIPKGSAAHDFRTVNALKWHGLTLTLGHVLFTRSASPSQLPDILTLLVSALGFEQKTATGGSVGGNVRDAANFGMWSVARRYTTSELLQVDSGLLAGSLPSSSVDSIIQILAIHLVLAACLDPVGNVRRGSSAAFQELVGRHPDQVVSGIAIVQVLDYQAVGLRRRAAVDVVNNIVVEHKLYWKPLADALFGWRGLRSPDVASRDAAASSISTMSMFDGGKEAVSVAEKLLLQIEAQPDSEVETRHGLTVTLAYILKSATQAWKEGRSKGSLDQIRWAMEKSSQLSSIAVLESNLDARAIRSDLPAAACRLASAMCCIAADVKETSLPAFKGLILIETATERLMTRNEPSVLEVLPTLVQQLLRLKQQWGEPLGCIGPDALSRKVTIYCAKSTTFGACYAVALGALSGKYRNGLAGEEAALSVVALADAMSARNVEWRIVSMRAIGCALQYSLQQTSPERHIVDDIANAIHKGLNDYTIDERGDIGSLVRLEALSSTEELFKCPLLVDSESESQQWLRGDVVRLSLEKLDKVRLKAAQLRNRLMHFDVGMSKLEDIASVSDECYFQAISRSLDPDRPEWELQATLKGFISCAGISAEPLLQTSRQTLAQKLDSHHSSHLLRVMNQFSGNLTVGITESGNVTAALEVLAFLLDIGIPQRLAKDATFKWRNLLSTVQKSHHKSNDIPKLLAAVHVYVGLAEIPRIRSEVLKKLISMLRTNPYPRVRWSIVEALFVVTGEAALKEHDWTKPSQQHGAVIKYLQEEYTQAR